jgi:hypothetical protein
MNCGNGLAAIFNKFFWYNSFKIDFGADGEGSFPPLSDKAATSWQICPKICPYITHSSTRRDIQMKRRRSVTGPRLRRRYGISGGAGLDPAIHTCVRGKPAGPVAGSDRD